MSGGSDEIRRFFVKCSWNSKNSKKNLDSENTFYGFYSIFSYLTIYIDFVDFIFQDWFLDLFYIKQLISESRESEETMNQTKGNLSTFFLLFMVRIFLIMIFKIFSGLETAFDVDRNWFGVLSTCGNVPENFEEIWPRLDRLCQIWRIGRLGLCCFGRLRVKAQLRDTHKSWLQGKF